MSDDQQQYGLRSLFIAVTVIAVLVGAFLGFARMAREADRKAVRNAYQQGRLPRENALEYLGPHDEAFREAVDAR